MLYMVTFTINIPQMLAYIPYMDPMGSFVGKIMTFQLFDGQVHILRDQYSNF